MAHGSLYFCAHPPALPRELRQSKRLQNFFDSLPDSTRYQIDREVREVKNEGTRLRCAQYAAECLMEAEFDPAQFSHR